MLWMVLWSCATDQRRPGYTECDPVPSGNNCVVWLCYGVIDANSVEYWVEHGENGRVECDGDNCTDALTTAINRACGSGA